MGNSIGVKKRTAKIMKIDGTAFRLKPPVQVSHVLQDHPGFTLLESGEVKQLGVRAKPLGPDVLLKAGKLYFLVELPRLPDKRAPRRAWSGALHVGAKERLETLMLTRRSTSDLTPNTKSPSIDSTNDSDGGLRLKMRLPKKEVEKLMQGSKDSNEAAEKIMELIKAQEASGTPSGMTPVITPVLRSPLRSPAVTPALRSPMRPSANSHTKMADRWPSFTRTPERWPSFTRTPEPGTPDGKDGRKEKRTRFVALPDEIIA